MCVCVFDEKENLSEFCFCRLICCTNMYIAKIERNKTIGKLIQWKRHWLSVCDGGSGGGDDDGSDGDDDDGDTGRLVLHCVVPVLSLSACHMYTVSNIINTFSRCLHMKIVKFPNDVSQYKVLILTTCTLGNTTCHLLPFERIHQRLELYV